MPTFLPLSSSLCYWRSLILTRSLIHLFTPSAHTQASRRTHQDTYTRGCCPPVVCGVARHAEASMDCTSTAMIRFFPYLHTPLTCSHSQPQSHSHHLLLVSLLSPTLYLGRWSVRA
ncbi:hypothetical protein GGI35DRAFT_457890 [Trichoderma velutinum]